MRPAVDDKHWGRVETVWSKQTERAEFTTLLYVTDKGQTKSAPYNAKISDDGITGAIFGKTVTLFATSRDRRACEINATVAGPRGKLEYFVSGVQGGAWSVCVDGKDYGTHIASEDGGLLVFSAPAGNISICPKD